MVTEWAVDRERDWWQNQATEADVWGDAPVDDYIRAVTPVLDGATRVLDLGCGSGRLAVPLAMLYPDVTVIGVDISSRWVQQAEQYAQRQDGVENVVFVTQEGRSLPGIFYDGAYSVALFQHLPEDGVRAYVSAVAQMLNPGGVFRFQFVEGDSHAFLDHKYSLWQMRAWSLLAKLDYVGVDRGLVHDEWTWLTVRKP